MLDKMFSILAQITREFVCVKIVVFVTRLNKVIKNKL